MCSNKINWIIILLLINFLAIIKVIFRETNLALEVAIISGFILIGIIGVYGVLKKRRYGQGLLLFLFCAMILNQFYLYFKQGLDNYLILAFMVSFLGLISVFTIQRNDLCKHKRRIQSKALKDLSKEILERNKEKPKKTVKKKSTKKKVPKKKKTAKKKTSKKKATKKKKKVETKTTQEN
jgi:hypothetical protein